ncbi:Syntaxin-binding protein 5, partial [Cucurbita argyrosperma subsp. argyrosperma]
MGPTYKSTWLSLTRQRRSFHHFSSLPVKLRRLSQSGFRLPFSVFSSDLTHHPLLRFSATGALAIAEMFVKKLVEKASRKPGSTIDGLKGCEVEPRVAFHYGIPSGSTIYGQIKLFGKDNSQALLESKEALPSKFLQFMENQGFLLNVTPNNQIEVWDIDRKLLVHVHAYDEEITSFTILQQSSYMYVGDYLGNVSILKLDQSLCNIIQMKYIIPVSASRAEVTSDTYITHILPQPTAEFKRVLLILNDGLITLWEIKESKSIFITGGHTKLSSYQEAKKVTSACWVCSLGSKVAVGYSNGEVLVWAILYGQNQNFESVSENSSRSGPLCKLNLGYKLDKIPIASLRCNYVDAKASRLYVMGASSNSLQVVLLNEQIEARMIKVGLQLSEPCVDMDIISSLSDHSKNKQDYLLLLGKSGCVYTYDDCLIEKYLLQQCQSRTAASLPKEARLKIPFVDSHITVARFFTNNSCSLYASDEDYIQRTKDIPSLFLSESKPKEVSYLDTVQFVGFSKVENLYISGHNDGSINFWDASSPIFFPIYSLQQQVSVFDIQGSSLIYQKRVASEISTGIISLQFESCNLQGFEKNVLTIATVDSSILAVDGETGNTLSASMVHPKKPSRALFMQVLYGQDASTRGSGIAAVDSVPKQSLVLLCSEKAAYIYSFVHAVQGIKKVLYKKKYHSSCCWASTFYSTSDVGLLLVFDTGKIEIRSLPELSLLKETSVRGVKYSSSKANSLPESIICSSKDGELLVVNGDREIFIVSVLCHKKMFRTLDSVSHIYRKDHMLLQELTTAPKEKRKGIFSSVFQEIAGNKPKQTPDIEIEDNRESVEELSVIFSSSNFHRDVKIVEGSENLVPNEDKSALDIDDIELDDPVEKPKEQSKLAALNKQKLASTFNSLKGKLKQMKVKTEKNSAKEEQPDWNNAADNKAGAVDQIKKKYGFSSAGDTSVAKMAESKLQENITKLQGINLRATDMQDTAKSFSSMATQLLRTVEQGKRN